MFINIHHTNNSQILQNAQVKNKIKRVDRLLGNESLHHDIPLIFINIISMLTSKLSLCVIAVD